MSDDKKEEVKDQEELNNLTDEEIEKLKKKVDLIAKARGLTKDIRDLSEQQLKSQTEMSRLLRDTADLIGDRLESSKQNLDLNKNLLEQFVRTDEKMQEMTENGEKLGDQVRRAAKELELYGTQNVLSLTHLDKNLQSYLNNIEKEASIKRGMAILDDNGLKVADALAESVGLRLKYKDSLFAKSSKMLKVLQDEGQAGKDAREAMANYLKDIFSLNNMALNIFETIKKNSIDLFNNFDKAQASLAAATGQGDKFRGTLYEVGREGNLFGVSMDDAGKAIGAMVDQTSNFTSMSKATQASLALNVAKMEKLGVATSDSAAIFQNFNQALGMTADESMKMQTELAMAGVSIGVNAAKMTKDFNASLSTLMVYGRESVDVFKGIAAAAKAAGVETSTLLSIAGKFDTFSGAAEGAGKLNALLGTQLSTTEMLMATEDERIRMLVESVQSQGVAFQDMDRFTQKAIANAAGITDMAEANRIFGMSLDAYDENERKLNASADAQKKLDDAVAKTVPVMDQFKKLGAELVVALEPFLETLESGAKALTDFFKSMDTEDKEMLSSVISIFAGLILITPVIKGFLGAMKLFSFLMPAASKTAEKSGKGFAKFGKGVGKGLASAGKGMLQFGLGLIATMAPIITFVAAASLLAAAIAGIGYAFSAVIDSAKEFYGIMFGTSETETQVKQFEARAAEAMATIVSSNHEGALSSIKAMVEEVNKMGQDIKVSSTIENLALITAGKASSITGERVVASQTSVTANVQNFFEGMEMTLMVDDTTALKTYVAKVASGEA